MVTTVAEDTFNRGDGALDGSTMSDGSNTWADQIGVFGITSQKAHRSSGPYPAVAMCDSMAEVADQQVTATGSDYRNCGPCARLSVSGTETSYRNISVGDGQFKLGKVVAGSQTLLGTPAADGGRRTQKIVCDGTDISLYADGDLMVGPVSDSAIATGRAGMWGIYTGNTLDDWKAESLGSAPTTTTAQLSMCVIG